MTVVALVTVIILPVVASHVHCQLKPPFKKQQEFPTSKLPTPLLSLSLLLLLLLLLSLSLLLSFLLFLSEKDFFKSYL